jgi:hypothetical protein
VRGTIKQTNVCDHALLAISPPPSSILLGILRLFPVLPDQRCHLNSSARSSQHLARHHHLTERRAQTPNSPTYPTLIPARIPSRCFSFPCSRSRVLQHCLGRNKSQITLGLPWSSIWCHRTFVARPLFYSNTSKSCPQAYSVSSRSGQDLSFCSKL